MPSPIAHLGAGYAIYRYYKRQLPEDRWSLWKFPLPMLLIMALSVLPDVDIIAAIVFRDMQHYHNNLSHSLLLGIPIAALIAATLRQRSPSDFWVWFLICLISYDLHIVMDALTAERGVMMLWPLSQTRYAFPIKLFYGVQWGLGWFTVWHLWTVFTESVFVLVLVIVVSHLDKRRNRSSSVLS